MNNRMIWAIIWAAWAAVGLYGFELCMRYAIVVNPFV